MDRQRIRESTHAKRPHRRTDRLTSHRTRLPADPRRDGLPPTALVQYSRTCRHECFLRHVARGRSTIQRDWCGNYRTRKRLACRPAIAGRLLAFDTRLSGCRICESPEQKSMCVFVCARAHARPPKHRDRHANHHRDKQYRCSRCTRSSPTDAAVLPAYGSRWKANLTP